MEDNDQGGAAPVSLLPYETWTEDAMRGVMVRALHEVAAHGLPGEHHFYVTFRTDAPGVVLPQRLRAEYPGEMTVVLQHQFWDLTVDEQAGQFSVGLSFGGIPTTLVVPFNAITTFADPFVQFGMRLTPKPAAEAGAEAEAEAPAAAGEAEAPVADSTPQVVSLDAFRRRSPKDSA